MSGRASVVNEEIITDAGSGLATFDWHMIALLPPVVQDFIKDSLDILQQIEVVCSTASLLEGALMEDHTTPAYFGFGAQPVTLHYLLASGNFLMFENDIRANIGHRPEVGFALIEQLALLDLIINLIVTLGLVVLAARSYIIRVNTK